MSENPVSPDTAAKPTDGEVPSDLTGLLSFQQTDKLQHSDQATEEALKLLVGDDFQVSVEGTGKAEGYFLTYY